jgi:hypothetical protein
MGRHWFLFVIGIFVFSKPADLKVAATSLPGNSNAAGDIMLNGTMDSTGTWRTNCSR